MDNDGAAKGYKVVFICIIGLSNPLQNTNRGSKRYVYSESDFLNFFPNSISQQSTSKIKIEGPTSPVTPFNFSIEVSDNPSGNIYSHKSKMQEDVKNGEYRVGLPDGRTQIVQYFIDESGGYNAKVNYEGNIKPYLPVVLKHNPEAKKLERTFIFPFNGSLEQFFQTPAQNSRKVARQAYFPQPDSDKTLTHNVILQADKNAAPVNAYYPVPSGNTAQKEVSNSELQYPISLLPTQNNKSNDLTLKQSAPKISNSLFYKPPEEKDPLPLIQSNNIPDVTNLQTSISVPQNTLQIQIKSSPLQIDNSLAETYSSSTHTTEVPKQIFHLPSFLENSKPSGDTAILDAGNVEKIYIPPTNPNQAGKVKQTYILPTNINQAVITDAENVEKTYILSASPNQTRIPDARNLEETYILPTNPDQASIPNAGKVEQTYIPPSNPDIASTHNAEKVDKINTPPANSHQARIPDAGNVEKAYILPTNTNQASIPIAGKVEQIYKPPTNPNQASIPNAGKVEQIYLPPTYPNQAGIPDLGKIKQTYIQPTDASKATILDAAEQTEQTYIPPTNTIKAPFPDAGKVGQTYVPPANFNKVTIPVAGIVENKLEETYFAPTHALGSNTEDGPSSYVRKLTRQVYQSSAPEKIDQYNDYKIDFGTPKLESVIQQPSDPEEYNVSQYIVPRSNYNLPSSSYG